MSETLTIQTYAVSTRCCVVALSGRLDAGSSQAAKDSFQQIVSHGASQLVVDLEQVPFVDSAGLSALVSALKLCRRAGGNVLLSSTQPQVQTVFSLTMLDRIFPIYPTRQAALDTLSAPTG
jgi:anti-sigma B factor antagonist